MNREEARSLGRSTILRACGTLITLGLLFFLLAQQGWQEIVAAFRQIETWRLGLVLILMLLSRLAVSARWYVLLRSGGVDMSLGQSMRITFAGLFANNFLPTTIGGDVIRLAAALRFKFDTAVCTASLVADRLVGMAGMAMTLPFGLPRYLEMQSWVVGSSAAIKSIDRCLPRSMISATGFVAFAGFFASSPIGRWGLPLWNKGLSLLRQVFEALALWLKQPRALFLALVFTWIHMLCLFGVLVLLFEGMGEVVSFWLVAGLYSLVYFVTLLPISINGYGLQELSMTLVFSRLGGVSVASGITGALLFRTLLMLASLPGAAFVPDMISGIKHSSS